MPALNAEQTTLRASAQELAVTTLRPGAERIDRERAYPQENLAAIAATGLFGLLVAPENGGRGGSLQDLALVCEQFGAGCASTAMCFLMHSCGCALIGARATDEQARRWLKPAARGDAILTLAFSERLTGAHFYQPDIGAARQDGNYRLSGRKSFVTSGGHAAFYPLLVKASGEPGLDVFVVARDAVGVSFEGNWDGIGMAGNSSVGMALADVSITNADLLGKEGDGMDLVFNVVAPTFLVGLAAVNIGIAQAALDAAVSHVKERRYENGSTLAEIPIIQQQLGGMSVGVESARQLVAEAARAASAAEPTALPLVMQAKIVATETATAVTGQAMQIGGGIAYSRQLPIERHWRDARAGGVMAPTNEVLKEWLGTILAGLPLF